MSEPFLPVSLCLCVCVCARVFPGRSRASCPRSTAGTCCCSRWRGRAATTPRCPTSTSTTSYPASRRSARTRAASSRRYDTSRFFVSQGFQINVVILTVRGKLSGWELKLHYLLFIIVIVFRWMIKSNSCPLNRKCTCSAVLSADDGLQAAKSWEEERLLPWKGSTTLTQSL